MKNQKTLLFVSPKLSSFTKNDLIILSKTYRVKQNIYDWSKKKKNTPLPYKSIYISSFQYLVY